MRFRLFYLLIGLAFGNGGLPVRAAMVQVNRGAVELAGGAIEAAAFVLGADAELHGHGLIAAPATLAGRVSPGTDAATVGLLAFSDTVAFDGAIYICHVATHETLDRIVAAGDVTGAATVQLIPQPGAIPLGQIIIDGGAGSDFSAIVADPANAWRLDTSGAVSLRVTDLYGDTDTDGLPDWWEMLYFGGRTASNPFDDSDQDGFSNFHEYIAGTDPTDFESLLKIAWLNSSPDGVSVDISWQSVPGKRYRMDSCTNLETGDWASLVTDLVATPPLTVWNDATSHGLRFYRVMVEGPDSEYIVRSRNIAGYSPIPVQPGLNLVAVPFQKIPATQGVVTANDGTTISDGGASWIAGYFNAGVVGSEPTGASTFYIEITSGAFEGRHFTIESNTDTTLTIAGGLQEADIEAGELVGAAYKIVAANRIRDLFGEPGEPLLLGGVGAADSDNILIWSGTGWAIAIYYKDDGMPPANVGHWNQGSTIVDDAVIDRDQAVFVLNRGPAPLALSVVGEVSPNSQQIVLYPGLNLVGGLSVVNEVIGDSGLADGLAGGPHAGVADTILEWSGIGWRPAVYYNTANMPSFGLASNRWYRAGVDVHDTFSFDPLKGFFVRRRAATPAVWRRASPLEP